MAGRYEPQVLSEYRAIQLDIFDWVCGVRNITLPNDQQRISIVGSTGSGKTHAGAWHLSRQDFDRRPWIIYDYKGDELIGSIPGVVEISVYDSVPDEPGLYVVHPRASEDDALEEQLRKIWEHEDMGVWVDEGYAMGNRNEAFRDLLRQGRSKHISMIVLSQRPAWMDNFVFTEADFFQVFRLQNDKDVNRMQDFIHGDITKRIPKYHSYYYDVSEDQLDHIGPVPDRKAVLATFESKMAALGPRKI